MAEPIAIKNLTTAKYECIYGRGCDGLCCQNGRPPVPPEEVARIDEVLPRALPLMTKDARALVEAKGFLSNRVKAGNRMLRVVNGWCVFFHQGCVLHKLGADDGDAYRYKPVICGLFPLDRNEKDEWYIRQWGYEGEDWDLFCLNPKESPKPAAESLQAEIKLLEHMREALPAS